MKKISFLLVEDNEFDFMICKDILENHYRSFAEIKTVTSLKDALEEIGKADRSYDMILLDLNVDDSKGSSTLNSIVGKCAAPILVYSGVSDRKDIAESILNGASGYIIKGKDSPQVVINNINHTLANRRIRPVPEVLTRLAG